MGARTVTSSSNMVRCFSWFFSWFNFDLPTWMWHVFAEVHSAGTKMLFFMEVFCLLSLRA